MPFLPPDQQRQSTEGNYLLKLIQFYLNNTLTLRHNAAHYVVLYPQKGDRIVTTDSVTSLHPVYT